MPETLNPAWEYYEADPEIAEAMEAPKHKVRRGEFVDDTGYSSRTAGLRSAPCLRECAESFRALYSAGLSLAELARVYDACRKTMVRWRKRLRLPPRHTAWTPQRLALVRRCHEAGVPLGEAAGSLGVSVKAYQMARIKAGIRVYRVKGG